MPGGWIYRTSRRGAGVATCFVPNESGNARQLAATRRVAEDLKQKLEQLKRLMEQLSAARALKRAQVRSTKVH